MFKLKCSTRGLNHKLLAKMNLTTKNSLLNALNAKFFSQKLDSFSKQDTTSDFYESTFKVERPPEHISTFNDLDGSFASEVFNKLDLENLSTLPLLDGRFSRIWCLTEDTLHHVIMFMTHELSMGIGFSTIVLAGMMRLLFYPMLKINIMRLLFPDSTEHKEKIAKLKEAGESQLVLIETERWKKIQRTHGFYTNPLHWGLNLFQGLVLAVWAGLIQRFSFNVEDYPEMITGGFLWFKDLSMNDPYFILPLLNACTLLVNLYNNNANYASPVMQKTRRFVFIMPLFSCTFMSTLETGIVLYFLTQSFANMVINLHLSSAKTRQKLGVNNFLPGTKMDRLNKFRLVNDKIDVSNQVTTESSTGAEEHAQDATKETTKKATVQQVKKEKTSILSKKKKK